VTPTVCLHIGTHKTGTKALQAFLYANLPLLAQAGILVPRAGQHLLSPTTVTPGHHEIAWELLDGSDSPAFDALLAEITSTHAPMVLVSSEDFQFLHRFPERLAAIARRFAAIGYETKVVAYLRSQPYYAQSLFAEYVKNDFVRTFTSFLETILRDGALREPGGNRTVLFEYGALLAPFAQAFGASNLVVRPYHGEREPEFLFRDFLTLVARFRGGLNLQGLQNPLPRANQTPTFTAFLSMLRSIAVERGRIVESTAQTLLDAIPASERPDPNARLALLAHDEVTRFLERFASDNAKIEQAFGITIPLTSPSEIPPATDVSWESARVQRKLYETASAQWSLSA
jgi:hypothetical protein